MENFRLMGRLIAAALMIVGIWWLVIDHTEVLAIGVGLLVSVFIGAVVIDLWDE